MTKQEFMRANQVNQMPRLVQVLVGKLYDAAFDAGQVEGYRRGVDAVADKSSEIYKAMYDEGAKDATHRGNAAFLVAACKVLHRPPFRFGAGRMRSVVDGINDELIGMIDPAEAVREVRSWGIHIDYDDELAGELDGLEEFG